MNPSRRRVSRCRSLVLLLACAGLLVSSHAVAQEDPLQKEIAKLEKQLSDLNKRLEKLRKEQKQRQARSQRGNTIANWAKGLRWRPIGPATMGGRITALAVYEKDPCIYYVATASGGLLKTVNAGNTFVHQFDKQTTVSIGDVAVAPSNPNIVWVGTGENNPRNSVSYGDGVYKSTDGGKTWKNMGLKKSYQIGRIAIHPTNPDIVYVGAMGRLYGPNKERGLFKTTNGGKTWKKIHFINDKTGVIDVQMHPGDPQTLLIATWERQRDAFDSHRGEPKLKEGYDAYDPVKKWGPGSGIFLTTDGGKTFRKVTKGLPTSHLGRVSIDFYRKNPKVVYALVDCANIAKGTPPAPLPYIGIFGADAAGGARLTRVTQGGPAQKGGLQVGDVVLTVNGKPVKNYAGFIALVRKFKPKDKIKVGVSRNGKKQVIEVTLAPRPTRERTGILKTRPYWFAYGGQRANVQNQQGPNSHEYGGVYKSTDGGRTWKRVNSLNPRPMYFSQIRVDPSDDKYLYVCGISMHRSKDGGKTFSADASRNVHPDQHALWINPKDGRHMIVGCDGGFYVTHDRTQNWDHLNHLSIGQFYHVTVDTKKPYNVYGGMQDNGTWGGPSICLRGTGPVNADWVAVGGGDGFVCRVDKNNPDVVYYESQDGNMRMRNLKTGAAGRIRPQAPQGKRYRFNWNTPFILSHHNSKIYYCAGEYVFRSFNQGRNLKVISPEISRTKRGTGTALSESPRNPDVIYAGSDDGALWVTRDGGKTWTNITKNVPLPGPRWVATIEASRFVEGRVYVCYDGHRSDDDNPYVFVSEDFGKTFKPIRANLPWGSTRCLREDAANPNLLFVGTEFAAWASVDRGNSWFTLNSNLPTVAIHEIAVHPTESEIVAATHGRSIWILDIAPLREYTEKRAQADAYLLKPVTAMRWRTEPRKGTIYGSGMRRFVGQNPPRGAQIYYSLGKKAKQVTLKIVDAAGTTVRQLRVSRDPGLHRVAWDMNRLVTRSNRGASARPRRPRTDPPPTPAKKPGTKPQSKTKPKTKPKAGQPKTPPRRSRRFFRPTRPVPPGDYRIVLSVDGKEFTQTMRLQFDPSASAAAILSAAGQEADNGGEEEEGTPPIDP